MARIETVAPGEARGLRRLVLRLSKKDYGYVPGITQIVLPDLRVAFGIGDLQAPPPAPILSSDPPAARDARHGCQRQGRRCALTGHAHVGRAPTDG